MGTIDTLPTTDIFTTITSTVSGWLSNEWLKIGVAGIVGFAAGYVVKMIKG